MYTAKQNQESLLATLLSHGSFAEIEKARELFESCHGKTNGKIEVIFFRRPEDNKCPLEVTDEIWTEVLSFNFGDKAACARRLYVELAMLP